MATGQDLLDRMELLDQELQLQPGENNVIRGLLALNVAQDYFESQVATRPNSFGSSIGTITTAINAEYTAFPTGVKRVDRLQLIDPVSGLPDWELDRIDRVGGHVWKRYWPWNILTSQTPGRPKSFWTNGSNIFWMPMPATAEIIRWYGFQSAANITAVGTFAYPDDVMLPLASFATLLMSKGKGDDIGDLGKVAEATFGPVLDEMSRFMRDKAQGFQYRYGHDT